MSTAVLWNFCVADFDIRYRSVGEWNIAVYRSPLMAVHWDPFLLISGRQTSVSDRCACARLIAGRTTYRPLKRDCVWSLSGGSATWRCALWNDQRTGHFANQYFSLSVSLSLSHTHTHTHTNVRNRVSSLVMRCRIKENLSVVVYLKPVFRLKTDWPHAVRCGPKSRSGYFVE